MKHRWEVSEHCEYLQAVWAKFSKTSEVIQRGKVAIEDSIALLELLTTNGALSDAHHSDPAVDVVHSRTSYSSATPSGSFSSNRVSTAS